MDSIQYVCLCVFMCVYEAIISKEELVMNLEGYRRNISDVADIIPDTIEDIIIHNILLYFRSIQIDSISGTEQISRQICPMVQPLYI